jgi:hypothetical protein
MLFFKIVKETIGLETEIPEFGMRDANVYKFNGEVFEKQF